MLRASLPTLEEMYSRRERLIFIMGSTCSVYSESCFSGGMNFLSTTASVSLLMGFSTKSSIPLDSVICP